MGNKTEHYFLAILFVVFLLSSYVFAKIIGSITHFNENNGICSIRIKNGNDYLLSENKFICNFLKMAEKFKQNVEIGYQANLPVQWSSYDRVPLAVRNPRYKIIDVKFANRDSTWFSDKNGQDQFYDLEGRIDNVQYFMHSDRCYVSINDKRHGREAYSRKFHMTSDKTICNFALEAFLQYNDTVQMNATMDPIPNFSNNLDSLRLKRT